MTHRANPKTPPPPRPALPLLVSPAELAARLGAPWLRAARADAHADGARGNGARNGNPRGDAAS
jgi:hypothetical protein